MTKRWAAAWGVAAIAMVACAAPALAWEAPAPAPVAYVAPGQAYGAPPTQGADAAQGAATWARPGERVLDPGAVPPPPNPPAEAQAAPRPALDAAYAPAPGQAPQAYPAGAQAPAPQAAPGQAALQAQPPGGQAPAPQAPAGANGGEGGRGAAYMAEDQPLRLRDYEAPRDAQAAGEGAGGWASQLGGLLLKLLVVLALAGGAFLMVKRSGIAPNLSRLTGRGKHLAVMESVALGPQHALHLVSLGARGVALVATSPNGVASLGTFEGGLGMVPAADFASAYEQADGEVEAPLRAVDALRSFGRQGGRR